MNKDDEEGSGSAKEMQSLEMNGGEVEEENDEGMEEDEEVDDEEGEEGEEGEEEEEGEEGEEGEAEEKQKGTSKRKAKGKHASSKGKKRKKKKAEEAEEEEEGEEEEEEGEEVEGEEVEWEESQDDSVSEDGIGSDSDDIKPRCWRGSGQLNVSGNRDGTRRPGTRSQMKEEAMIREHEFRALRSQVIDETAGMDDLILKLEFDQRSGRRLCGKFEELPSVKAGLQDGMKLRVPRMHVGDDKAVCEDRNKSTASFTCITDETSFSFNDAYLKRCTKEGIGIIICNPSGGGEKYKVAYLDYSLMIKKDTPHVRAVFVKPHDAHEYRKRYPELILIELPERASIPKVNEIARVGDARFWIQAFVIQVNLPMMTYNDHYCAALTYRLFVSRSDASPCRAARRSSRGINYLLQAVLYA